MSSELEQSLEELFEKIRYSQSRIELEYYFMNTYGRYWFDGVLSGQNVSFKKPECVQECSTMVQDTRETEEYREVSITVLLKLIELINNVSIISDILQTEKHKNGPLWFLRFFTNPEDHYTLNIDELETFLNQYEQTE